MAPSSVVSNMALAVVVYGLSGNADTAEAWLDKAWRMVADLSPSQLRRDVGTQYADLLHARGEVGAARAVRDRI